MGKYYIITFGCQMNISDSERAATILETMGYKPASKQNEADLILINACSVRGSAIDRIHGLMPAFKALKQKNKKLKLVLTGCVLKADRKKFEENFDYILNIKDLPKWPRLLRIRSRELKTRDYLKIKPKYTNKKIVYIPISNGCDNFCTYCAVPYTRDRLKCRSHKDVLEEVKSVIKNDQSPDGAMEIWLLGQNVNDYKSPADSSIKFPKLLKLVNDIPGNFIIKFTSPHPKNFSSELIKTMASCKKIAHYLNLPMQSGDNKILKAMNRPYTAEQYKALVKKIRRAIPDINLSTDVIVGFPGETKKQFENTLKLFKELNFDMGYIARFSPRPGTLAAKMKDDVSPKEKARRWNIINNILLKKWSRRK
jgi:tRNA-2-methylthio-N6-dimethylallyladenosine synthase